MIYNETDLRLYLKVSGMAVDEVGLKDFVMLSQAEELSQSTFDKLTILHAKTMIRLFSPSTYYMWHRFCIAFHFIFNTKGL